MGTSNVIVNYSHIKHIKHSLGAEHTTAMDPALMALKTDDQLRAAVINADVVNTAMEGVDNLIKKSVSEALDVLEASERHSGVMTVTDNPNASWLQSFLAENASSEGKLDELWSGVSAPRFSEEDWLRWIRKSFLGFLRGRFGRHEWLTPSSEPDVCSNSMRLALIGDSATGMYGAPISKESIESDSGYDCLISLADVYYTGTKKETKERFLKFWPKNPTAISRALNGNHEMYSGGYGYFELTLPEFQQDASCFAFQNDHWLYLAIDSAYARSGLGFGGGELNEDQIEWLHKIVDKSADRKVIFFSHHPVYSSSGKLAQQVSKLLNDKKIFAWYYGHKHECVIYDQHPIWGIYGRCVGHGGVPYERFRSGESVITTSVTDVTWRKLKAKGDVPGGLVLDGPNEFINNHEREYGPHGYMTLEFNGKHLNEIVHLPDGTIIYERELA